MSIAAQLWMARVVTWAILVTIWFYLGNFCACFANELGCDLVAVGGVSSFAEISFALNTSITLNWFTNQFMAFFDRFAKNRLLKYAMNTEDEINETSMNRLYNEIEMLKSLFNESMWKPALFYRIIGIVFAILTAAFLLFGMPIWFRPYVILLPFPALAYYITSLLTGGLMIARFEEFLCLQCRK